MRTKEKNPLKETFLHLCTFKTPPKGGVISEQGDADCAFLMRNGVKGYIFTHS